MMSARPTGSVSTRWMCTSKAMPVSPAASTGQARVSFAWRDVEVSSSDGGLGSSPSGVPSPLRAVNCLLNTQKVKRARPSDRKIVYSVCNYAR